eukprot:m.34610 g.34610  ORF g.34610 m.34610 type:complete len:456 (-) comp8754_c0_seq2:332-1699(-)
MSTETKMNLPFSLISSKSMGALAKQLGQQANKDIHNNIAVYCARTVSIPHPDTTVTALMEAMETGNYESHVKWLSGADANYRSLVAKITEKLNVAYAIDCAILPLPRKHAKAMTKTDKEEIQFLRTMYGNLFVILYILDDAMEKFAEKTTTPELASQFTAFVRGYDSHCREQIKLAASFESGPTETCSPVFAMVRDVLTSLKRMSPSKERDELIETFPEQFADLWSDFVFSWMNDAAIFSARKDPTTRTLAEMEQARADSSAAQPCILMAQVASLAPPPSVRSAEWKTYTEAIRAGTLSVGYLNDVLSYHKEKAAGLDSVNIITYFMRNDNTSFDNAVRKAASRGDACARQCRDFLNTMCRKNAQLVDAAHAIALCIDGINIWQYDPLATKRYAAGFGLLHLDSHNSTPCEWETNKESKLQHGLKMIKTRIMEQSIRSTKRRRTSSHNIAIPVPV